MNKAQRKLCQEEIPMELRVPSLDPLANFLYSANERFILVAAHHTQWSGWCMVRTITPLHVKKTKICWRWTAECSAEWYRVQSVAQSAKRSMGSVECKL